MLKVAVIASGIIGVVVVAGIGAWWYWGTTLERPGYKVISVGDGYETRRYDSYLVAETRVEGRFDQAGNRAFPILAGYIFGNNTAREEMAMTTPVVSYDSDASVSTKMAMTAPVFSAVAEAGGNSERDATQTRTWTYQFVMERKYSEASLPAPVDPRVEIKRIPPRLVAARRFSGRWLEENVEDAEAALLDAVRADGIEPVGRVVLARYNDPFTPWFLRRNEVLVEIADG
jgi:hypothetical protein